MSSPESIRAHRDVGMFEIRWPERAAYQYPFKFLRCECPCAACVNEFTGERILDPATVPEDVRPEEVKLSGNYAMKVRWSDGHDTGLYSWDRLLQLANSSEVTAVAGEPQ